jgi:Ion channel
MLLATAAGELQLSRCVVPGRGLVSQRGGTYFVMGGGSEADFSEPLTRTDALYFTVTVFSTVGFGDITATTQGARLVVTGQMVAGIVIIGLGARIIVDAVKRGQQRQPMQAGEATHDAGRPLE